MATVSKKTYDNVTKQKKVAFAMYYETNYNLMESNKEIVELLEKLDLEKSEPMPSCLVNEMIDMMKKLKCSYECSICYDDLSKENTKFARCSHKYCLECYEKIDECAICRQKIYKPKK